jgi:endonuclease/exonuclease/phosphatase (EEP) superfamily protein YafD
MMDPDDPNRPTIGPPRREGLARKLARALGWSLAAAAAVHPLAVAFARLDWRADLLVHFREPALVVSLLAAAAMARIRRPVAVGVGLLALWQAWGLSACWWPNPVLPDGGSAARLRVLSANLLVDNDDRDRLIALVRRERPDVLGLIEASRPWLDGLEPIKSDFPYRYNCPSDEDGTGLALWFRSRPISVELVAPLTNCSMPVIHSVVEFAGKPRHLWLIHLVSPFVRYDCLAPGKEFAVLADLIRRDGGSAIVMGDFNSTDGSPYFSSFVDRSGLRDSRLGFGRQGSWPTWSPYRIAIDHAFLSPDLAVDRRRLGPPIGSDHLPLLLDVAPAASPSTNKAAHASHSSGDSGSGEANLARSASRRKATSRPPSSGPIRSRSARSSPISSVVFDPQPGPKAPIKAPRTIADDAIRR